jgi:hypothetical protein
MSPAGSSGTPHGFARSLAPKLLERAGRMAADGCPWVARPKRSSGVATDLSTVARLRANPEETPMTAPLVDLARQFRFNLDTLRMTTDGFGPDEWAATPSARGGNTAHWLLGHLAGARRSMLRQLGEDLSREPWEEDFGMSVTPSGQGYPSPDGLFADLDRSGGLIDARFVSMGAEALSEPPTDNYPDGGSTLEHAARFFFFHEVYHVGQLGLLRRTSCARSCAASGASTSSSRFRPRRWRPRWPGATRWSCSPPAAARASATRRPRWSAPA